MKRKIQETKGSLPRPGRRFDELGELQQAILEVLWARSEATVQVVRESLHRTKTPAYTTVLSILQKLERNGWISHRLDGRSYVYKPRVTYATERSRSLRALLDRLFGGDPMHLFEHLLEDPRISDEDFAKIRKMIRKKRSGNGS